MRAIVVMISIVVLSGIARAEPCVTVSAADPGDAAAIRRALIAAIPSAPHACLDVAIESTVREAADEITLVETVRVMISDDHGHMKSVLSGGATAHVARGSSRRLPMYRRDALEQAIDGLAPAILSHLVPPAQRPTS
jgi:hypothetical protein